MKKDGILKAIGILFLIYVVASWIIPVGYYSTEFTSSGTLPVGLVDLIKYPIINLTSSVFILMAICILFIGGLYAVLNKTGVYSKLVDGIVKKFKKNSNTFLIISILVFSILSSITALTLPLFAMVPLFIAVILLLGYSKIVALLSTVGAILVGNLASTYGFNISGYINYFYETGINTNIMFKIILFVLLVGALIMFVLKLSEKKSKYTKDETLEIPFYEKNTAKTKTKKPLAMIILLVTLMVLVLVGMYNWKYGLNVDVFDNIHSAVTEFEIKGYPIFANIIGGIDALGYWSNYEFALILVVASLVIGLLFKLKLSDIIDSFIDGCKKMVPVALYVLFANIIFLLMNSNSEGTMFGTIANFMFTKLSSLGNLSVGIVSAIGSLFYNDFPYMINMIYSQVGTLFESVDVATFIQQTIHGLLMLVLPTSTILIAGLKYLNVSYKEWLKNVWKYLLIALIIIIVMILLMSIL